MENLKYVIMLYCFCSIVTKVVAIDPAMVDQNVVTCGAGAFIGKNGIVERGEHVFKFKMFLGIPYAQSPTGNLRFKKPVKPVRLEEPYDATVMSAPCFDRDAVFNGSMTSQDVRQMSEDCLFLNVFVPFDVKQDEKLPVIIFIHEKTLDFVQISELTNGFKDVVFVQVQYRMNFWGFTSSGEAGGNFPGNVGLWDQHFAITWVHNNIRAFSGSPDLVTLIGYFEGASNVLYQAMYEGNDGLFKRIIVNCGSARCPWGVNAAPNATAEMIGRTLDCKNASTSEIIACISSRTSDEIVESIRRNHVCVQFSYETPVTIDGIFITGLPHEMFDPFNILGIKQRHLLSKYEILTAVYQEGGWGKPANWMNLRVTNGSMETVLLGNGDKEMLLSNKAQSKKHEIYINDTYATEYEFEAVNNYISDSINSDIFLDKMPIEMSSEIINKVLPESCFDDEYDIGDNIDNVSDQVLDIANIMLGADYLYNEKAETNLDSMVKRYCNNINRSSMDCFVSSYHTGGPLWVNKRVCYLHGNDTIMEIPKEFYPFGTEDGSDPLKPIAPPINDIENILVHDSVSELICRTLPDSTEGNTSTVDMKLLAGSIWTTFAKTGALSSVVALGANIICNKIPGLAPRQRAICRSRPVAIAVIGGGARLGLNECQYQFRNMRWNCSMASRYDSMFGYQHDIASREAAVWSAMASSGVVYAITQACSLGTLNECGCDKSKMNFRQYSKNNDFMWGGCSADVKYGLKLARKFLDAREIEQTARSLMNKHNNKVGRKAVRDNMKLECRCHGPTGSCSLKTCWRRLPSFRDVGDYLLKQYHKSKQVVPWRGSRLLRPNALVLKKSNRPNKKPRRRDLVFLELSPNFCEHNLTTGSLGTVGRKCNKGSRGNDGCTLMCCGRGYNTHQYTRTWQCNCTFRWCCEVNCKNCTEKRLEYTCK